MAELVYLKESIKQYYQKHSEYIDPVLKFVFSFIALLLVQDMFRYSDEINRTLAALFFSAIQVFLPCSFLFYSASLLVAFNLWSVSFELCVVFLVFIIICYLLFIRVNPRYAFIIILTVVLFYLRLEYFLPVLLGMTVGIGGVLPMAAGTIIYFFSTYIEDVSTLLTTTVNQDLGIGISRMVNLMIIDKRLLVYLITFCVVTFIAALLYRMFYENAWVLAVLIGNVAMALLLLSGRLIFELDYTIWRVFVESVLAIATASVFQFFRGIGDFSRMEKVSFEDDEYIYFVKAVPKIKVARTERKVTDIIAEDSDEDDEL